MNMTGNTIFITGGGSGIGRGLAEAFHKLGNQVIISGRRKSALEETTKTNPGMASIELDIENPESIHAAAKHLIAAYPKLNVLMNNAGHHASGQRRWSAGRRAARCHCHHQFNWTAASQFCPDRAPKSPAVSDDHLQHIIACIRALGRHIGLFSNEGGSTLLCSIATIQATEVLGEGPGTGSPVGEDRFNEQPRGRSGDAA